MTANELADVFNTYAEPHDWGKQAVIMLRQQQAEIERLIGSEPVAIRYDFDGYGYKYMDSGSGSDWQTRVIGEPLYTHPIGELSDEEIIEIASPMFVDVRYPSTALEFAKDLLKKASEKI